MTLSEMITLVRRELKDESSALWSDDNPGHRRRLPGG